MSGTCCAVDMALPVRVQGAGHLRLLTVQGTRQAAVRPVLRLGGSWPESVGAPFAARSLRHGLPGGRGDLRCPAVPLLELGPVQLGVASAGRQEFLVGA